MLTIKKRVHLPVILLVGLLSLTACAPPGYRALRKGAQLVDEGNFSEAIPRLQAATQLLNKEPTPVQAKAWNYLGLALQHSGDLPRAVQAYERAHNLDRNLAAADFNLGCAHVENKNFPAAVDALTTFVALQPKHLDGLLKLGEAQMHLASQVTSNTERNRHLDNARRTFESAQKVSSTPEALNALGVIQLQRSRVPNEAIKNFRAALEKKPDYAPALLNLAIVYHQTLNEHALALQKYRDYLAVKPRAGNWQQVERIALELDAELNPRPVMPPTNAVARTALAPVAQPTNRIVTTTNKIVAASSKPAALAAPTRIETNKPVTPAAPTIVTAPAAKPASNSVPVIAIPSAKSQPVPVVALQQEAPIKPAQDVVVTPLPKVSSNAVPVVEPRTNPSPKAVEEKKKSSLVQKINPVNWFGKKNKTAPTNTVPPPSASKPETAPATSNTSLPEHEVRPSASSPSNSPTALAPAPKPPPLIAHYKYVSPAKPAPGDTATAKKFFAQATKAQHEHRLNDSLAAYREAVKADPAFYDGWYFYSFAAKDAKDYPAALNALENALAIQPESTDARYAFAWLLQKADFPQESANELLLLLAQNPSDVRAHLLLGNLYAQKLQQPKRAREHYLIVLQSDPRHPQATEIRNWLAMNP